MKKDLSLVFNSWCVFRTRHLAKSCTYWLCTLVLSLRTSPCVTHVVLANLLLKN